MASDTTNITTYIDVLYYPNISMYGAVAARLVVTTDGRIVLTSAEGSTDKPIYREIFNISAGEVVKASLMVDQFTIKLASKTHRMSISQYMTPLIATGGVVGGAVAYGMQKKTGARAFVDVLRSLGIKASYMGVGKLYGIATIIAIALIAAIAVGAYFFD